MTDLLRAWSLLTPEEQKETGLHVVGGSTLVDWDGSEAGVEVSLIVAVEDVLLGMGYAHMHGNDNEHHWGDPSHIIWGGKCSHSDRLTAAMLALESERGTR